jgi:hypothetical protein
MSSSSNKPSPGIIAAGFSAILLGLLVALTSALAFRELLRPEIVIENHSLPPYARVLSALVWIAFLLGSLYLALSGAAAIRLRNWARISLLVISGMMLFFGSVGIVVVLFVLFSSQLPGIAGSKAPVVAALALIYGLPIAAALWWLIFFTRRSTVAQFQARASTLPPRREIRFSKQGCPVAVSVVAWLLLSSVLSLVIVPLLPFPVPVILFGHQFHGPPAMALFLPQVLLITVASIGLLRLKRWSFPLSVALQLFYLTNGLFALFSPSFTGELRLIQEQMQLPPLPTGMPDLAQYARYFGWVGLLVPLACLIALFYARDSFYAASHSSEGQAASPQAD